MGIGHDLVVAAEVVGGVMAGAGALLLGPEIAAGAAIVEGAELLAGLGLAGLEGAASTATAIGEGVELMEWGSAAVSVAEDIGAVAAGTGADVGGALFGVGTGLMLGAPAGAATAGLMNPGSQVASGGNNPQSLPPPGSAAAGGSSGYYPGSGGGASLFLALRIRFLFVSPL